MSRESYLPETARTRTARHHRAGPGCRESPAQSPRSSASRARPARLGLQSSGSVVRADRGQETAPVPDADLSPRRGFRPRRQPLGRRAREPSARRQRRNSRRVPERTRPPATRRFAKSSFPRTARRRVKDTPPNGIADVNAAEDRTGDADSRWINCATKWRWRREPHSSARRAKCAPSPDPPSR